MFTICSARASFLDGELGSIEAGKLADLVVLARNPLATPADELADIPVDLTILGGRIAYRR